VAHSAKSPPRNAAAQPPSPVRNSPKSQSSQTTRQESFRTDLSAIQE